MNWTMSRERERTSVHQSGTSGGKLKLQRKKTSARAGEEERGALLRFNHRVCLWQAQRETGRPAVNVQKNRQQQRRQKIDDEIENEKVMACRVCHLDVVAFADEAPGDEGVDAQAVEDPVRVVHLRADRPDRRHRAEETVRAYRRGVGGRGGWGGCERVYLFLTLNILFFIIVMRSGQFSSVTS